MFAKMAAYDQRMLKPLQSSLRACLGLPKDTSAAPGVARGGVGDWQRRGAVELWRSGSCFLLAAALLALSAVHWAVEAGWLAKVAEAAEQAGPRAAKLESEALERAAIYVRSLPDKPPGSAVLAAEATQEGHWRFVNTAGETLTAGTPQELTRVAAILLPEAKSDVKRCLDVTEDTTGQYTAAPHALPE